LIITDTLSYDQLNTFCIRPQPNFTHRSENLIHLFETIKSSYFIVEDVNKNLSASIFTKL